MDYKNTGLEVFAALGGNQNVVQLTHCATRLRFEVKNRSNIDLNKIKQIDGVLDVIDKSGQIQVVIGQDVQIAYRAINDIFSGNDTQTSEALNKTKFEKFTSMMLGIFNPIIPPIMGTGMIKAVLAILNALNWVDSESSTYFVINFISDAPYYFLPMLIAYSTARYFKTNVSLAITVAGVLLHPSFTAAVSAQDPVQFFGMNVPLASYGSSVFPIILTVILMSYVEKYAEKWIPTVIKFVFKPLVILAITAPIALLVLGPIGFYAGNGLGSLIDFINSKASWLVPMFLGGTYPLLIMTGMHSGMAPLAVVQLSSLGYENIIGPAALAHNISEGGAALAVAFKAKKNNKLRQTAVSAGISALMGVTEPAIYGVNLPLKRPVVVVMISGAIAGFVGGITGLVRYSFGAPGIPTLPVYIGENPMNIFKALAVVAISFTISFVITMLVKIDIPLEEEKQSETPTKTLERIQLDKNISIPSPLSGEVVELKEVPDAVFANLVLGKGVAINPDGNEVVAPFDGTVITLFPTRHAIGLVNENGCEVLIHIGIDTVQLDGEFFEAKVKQGDKVKKGQVLVTFDRERIKHKGYSLLTPIVITNTADYEAVVHTEQPKVITGDELIFTK